MHVAWCALIVACFQVVCGGRTLNYACFAELCLRFCFVMKRVFSGLALVSKTTQTSAIPLSAFFKVKLLCCYCVARLCAVHWSCICSQNKCDSTERMFHEARFCAQCLCVYG